MTEDPTVLRSASGADFLASLPSLAGYTSRESLLVVPFRGTRTMGVIRVDLPPVDDEEAARAIGALACDMLGRMRGCDGAVLVVYTDDTFPVASIAREPLVAVVDEQLESAGFLVRDALCVSPDGWASWLESDAPAGGHPRSEIDDNPMRLRAEAVHGAPLREFDAEATLPEPDPDLARRMSASVADLLELGMESDAFGVRRSVASLDPIDCVEEILRTDPETMPVPLMARLIAFAAVPSLRDETIIQIAFGVKEARRAAKDNARLHARQLRTGRTMDDLVREEMSRGRRPFASGGDLLLGTTTRRPSRERIGTAIAVLRRAIAHVDEVDRPGALCVLAWLNWAIGRASIAGAHIQQARAIDPTLSMAQLMEVLFAGGRMPEWLYAIR